MGWFIFLVIVLTIAGAWFFGPLILDRLLLSRSRMRVAALTRQTLRDMKHVAEKGDMK